MPYVTQGFTLLHWHHPQSFLSFPGSRELGSHSSTPALNYSIPWIVLHRCLTNQTEKKEGKKKKKKSQKPSMEVEIKLRLPDATSHQKLSDLLSQFHVQTLIQENIFFDGANAELTSNLAVLRIRFYDDVHCVLSLKSKPLLLDGISRIEEQEEPFDAAVGRACIAEPWRLLSVDSSEILKRVKDEFKIGGQNGNCGLICLGGFRNVRAVYEWKGLKLEIDETNYDFGTSYEIECEVGDPEKHKKMIEDFLKENGIGYSYSKANKFAVFKSRKLPE